MAVKIDLNEIVSSTSKFCFDFHFFKLRGLADIPAKEFFLAMQEVDAIAVNNPLNAVVECMNSQEYEQFMDILDNERKKNADKNEDDDEYDMRDSSAFLSKFILKNDIPRLPTLRDRLMYAFVALEAKYLNICVNKMLASAIEKNTLEFDFISNKVGDISAEQFVAEVKNLKTLNSVAQATFLHTKKDFYTIYEKLLTSIQDFFMLAK